MTVALHLAHEELGGYFGFELKNTLNMLQLFVSFLVHCIVKNHKFKYYVVVLCHRFQPD